MTKNTSAADKAPRDARRGPPLRVATLIHDINRIHMEKMKRHLPDIQRSCRLIMMELAHKDNVTQLELVRATHLKAPTVSVSLQKMETAGWVHRMQDPDDLRATRVFLTEKGREFDQNILHTIIQQDDELESCLSEGEKELLMTLLQKIHGHMQGG